MTSSSLVEQSEKDGCAVRFNKNNKQVHYLITFLPRLGVTLVLRRLSFLVIKLVIIHRHSSFIFIGKKM